MKQDRGCQGRAMEGVLADKSTQLILSALSRAVHDPDGVPLHSHRNHPGLFNTTASAKQAAQRCKDKGFVEIVGTETVGKAVLEKCVLTEKGLSYLLKEANPKDILEDFVRVLEERQVQMTELLDRTEKTQRSMDSLREVTRHVLGKIEMAMADEFSTDRGPTDHQNSWEDEALFGLQQWHDSGQSDDCPLPILYRHVYQKEKSLTIGVFHDTLRQWHREGRLYLHPWTGPLYDMPEPQYALLIGHEIVYYASLRNC